MKTFTRDYKIKGLDAPIFSRYFGSLRPCVYDIETCGLSPQNSKVILTAMLIPGSRGVTVTQFLAENHYEENRVLAATAEFMKSSGIDYLITYNGMSFDIPFTNRRFEALGMPHRLGCYDLDLYRFLKRHSLLPTLLDSMRQKRVEGYFSLASDRRDTIDGRESVRMYNEYARSGSSVLEKVILTHNREDVLQLYRILLSAGHDDFASLLKSGSLHEALAEYGFPIAGGRLTARPRIAKSLLRINGRQTGVPFNGVHFAEREHGLTAEFNYRTMDYRAELPLYSESGALFADLAELEFSRELADSLALTSHDGYVNGYLLLAENGEPKQREINTLSELVMEHRLRCFTAVSEHTPR